MAQTTSPLCSGPVVKDELAWGLVDRQEPKHKLPRLIQRRLSPISRFLVVLERLRLISDTGRWFLVAAGGDGDGNCHVESVGHIRLSHQTNSLTHRLGRQSLASELGKSSPANRRRSRSCGSVAQQPGRHALVPKSGLPNSFATSNRYFLGDRGEFLVLAGQTLRCLRRSSSKGEKTKGRRKLR